MKLHGKVVRTFESSCFGCRLTWSTSEYSLEDLSERFLNVRVYKNYLENYSNIHYATIKQKKNTLFIYLTTWMNLKYTMLKEIYHYKNIPCISLVQWLRKDNIVVFFLRVCYYLKGGTIYPSRVMEMYYILILNRVYASIFICKYPYTYSRLLYFTVKLQF